MSPRASCGCWAGCSDLPKIGKDHAKALRREALTGPLASCSESGARPCPCPERTRGRHSRCRRKRPPQLVRPCGRPRCPWPRRGRSVAHPRRRCRGTSSTAGSVASCPRRWTSMTARNCLPRAEAVVLAVRCDVFSHCLAIGSGSGTYLSVCVNSNSSGNSRWTFIAAGSFSTRSTRVVSFTWIWR